MTVELDDATFRRIVLEVQRSAFRCERQPSYLEDPEEDLRRLAPQPAPVTTDGSDAPRG